MLQDEENHPHEPKDPHLYLQLLKINVSSLIKAFASSKYIYLLIFKSRVSGTAIFKQTFRYRTNKPFRKREYSRQSVNMKTPHTIIN